MPTNWLKWIFKKKYWKYYFQCYALKNSEHRQNEIVEIGDATVGAITILLAHHMRTLTYKPAIAFGIIIAWMINHHFSWNITFILFCIENEEIYQISANVYYFTKIISAFLFTCEIMKTRPMSYALKHFQSNNCVNDDYKHDEKCNMEEWYHCHQYSVQNDLETYHEIKRC